jgi:transposase InsO family protein
VSPKTWVDPHLLQDRRCQAPLPSHPFHIAVQLLHLGILAALRREGIATSGKRVARLMRKQDLRGRRRRRFKRTTIADPEAAAAVDLIKWAFGAPSGSTSAGARTSPT